MDIFVGPIYSSTEFVGIWYGLLHWHSSDHPSWGSALNVSYFFISFHLQTDMWKYHRTSQQHCRRHS